MTGIGGRLLDSGDLDQHYEKTSCEGILVDQEVLHVEWNVDQEDLQHDAVDGYVDP